MGLFDDIPDAGQEPPQGAAPAGLFDDIPAVSGSPGKKPAEMRAHDPTLRDKAAHGADWLVAHILGEDPDAMPSPIRDRIVTGLVGSRGLGQTNPSLADFSPAAPVFGGDEMQRAAKNGNWREAALDALSVVPATGAPVASAVKTFKPTGFGPMLGATEASRESAAAGKVAAAAQADVAARSGVPASQISQVAPQQLEHEATQIINAGTRNGQDVRLMDVGGEATRGEARRVANVAPEARGPMRDVIEPRFEMQSDRTIAFLKNAFNNPQDATKTLADLKTQAQATNAANYASVWANAKGVPITVNTPGLQQMMQSDVMKGFYADAAKRWETMRLAGTAPVPQSVNGVPTLAFWDQVKRVIGDKIDEAPPELARNLTRIKNNLVGYLDKAAPKYAIARGEAANFFKAGDAVEAGQMVVHGKWTPAEVRQVVAKMKPAELAQFQGGFLSDYLKELSFVRDKRDVLGKVMNSPGERAKIEAVLGPQKAKDFESFLTVETVMDMTRTAMGNSTTVRQGLDVARGSAGVTLPAVVGGAAALATGNLKAAVLGAIVYGARRAQRAIDQSVAEKVADMLLSKDPSVYANGLREVYKSEPLRSAFQAAAAVVAQGARTAPAAVSKDNARPAPANAMRSGASAGPTATNPNTGEKVIFRGGKWVPVQ